MGAELVFDVTEAASVVLQVAVPGAAGTLRVRSDARELPTGTLDGHGHLVEADPGTVTVSYTATVTLDADSPPPVSIVDRFTSLLPSRYCPADRMTGFALDRFGHLPPADRPAAIRAYVHDHLAYVSSASGPSTDAVDTLLAGQGVCRDYAHLMVALCRAANVPARVTSVYAPGLSPMDFHLVAETATGPTWQVWDPTGLAPRPSLVRIAIGRDAADVAFSTVLSGAASLRSLEVTAVVDGTLPDDDHTAAASLATVTPPRSR
ncbi:transglutaminase family protein [Virgisporangium ochraceum]|uniref:Putative transglutaminase-like protein n=1 Tax=Virgisporangium ochraceum TaxID=65505 RepID=A0A8J3ZX75_9ACTN|nr:transglutaminase family protein [Virgisporangium ochraceum]GIJ69051.1 putative transglutaminase-like protein [Virgisporangium ochraceum]